MICFTLHRTEPIVTLDRAPHRVDYLDITFEFSDAWQEDGHVPSDGDMTKAFVESLILNIPKEPIKKVLEENNIEGIKDISGQLVTIKKIDKTVEWVFTPIYEIKIRIAFVPEEDKYISVTRQLLNSVSWKDSKKAYLEGHASSWDRK